MRAVTFSQDGTRIVTGGEPYFAFAWAVPPPEMRAAAASETALALTKENWRAVQTMLYRAGQDVGPVDGLPGPRTRARLREWQRGRGDEATGYLTAGQTVAIREASPDAGPQDTVPTPERRLGPTSPGQCHVIVAARRDRDAVARFVNALPDALKKSYSVANSRKGWLVISVGVVPRDGFDTLRQALVDTGQLPADTYCTSGASLRDFNTDLPVFTGLIPIE